VWLNAHILVGMSRMDGILETSIDVCYPAYMMSENKTVIKINQLHP
jgi:hypothetical protein